MIIFAIIVASMITTLVGGLIALKLKDQLHLILGLSAGVILGVALFDILPEVVELTNGKYDQTTISVMIAFGFVVYMVIDRTFSIHSHKHDDKCENPAHSKDKNILGASALTFHSFLDGFGIGLAFKVNPQIGWVVAVGVLIHKLSDGVNTVGLILRNSGEKKSAYKWLLINSLAPAVGVAATYLFSISGETLGLVLAVFVGLFLYISASDLIPESHHHHPTAWTTISTVLGILVIYCAAILAK